MSDARKVEPDLQRPSLDGRKVSGKDQWCLFASVRVDSVGEKQADLQPCALHFRCQLLIERLSSQQETEKVS